MVEVPIVLPEEWAWWPTWRSKRPLEVPCAALEVSRGVPSVLSRFLLPNDVLKYFLSFSGLDCAFFNRIVSVDVRGFEHVFEDLPAKSFEK